MFLIAEVAIDVPMAILFDYKISCDLLNDLLIDDLVGKRVLVPFGRANKIVVGIIVSIKNKNDHEIFDNYDLSKIKSVFEIDSFTSKINSEMLTVCKQSSKYYHYPIGQILILCLSNKLRQSKSLSKNYLNLNTKFCDNYSSKDIIKNYKILYELNNDQQNAVEKLSETFDNFKISLLYGVTGSGKTEVYLNIIYNIFNKYDDAQILILVPEIILTPQLEAYFNKRFQLDSKTSHLIVSLHSGLTESQKQKNWYLATSGKAKIILGTRSAIFTSLPNLKLIIIDEEHDLSYKQQDDFRYSAKEIAILRARANQIPLILGSATPSFDTLERVQSKTYQIFYLNQKAIPNAILPKINLIDIRPLKIKDGLSDMAIHKIKETLAKNQQILLFINRRGYAPVIYCKECAWISTCPNCSASKLVYHKNSYKLICHHCGFQENLTSECPKCKSVDSLVPVGQGTERLDHHLTELFPNETILRIDTDLIKHHQHWLEARQKIESNETKIIVGTQMMTKGHDFKNISLVVVVNADSGLHSTDFRSEEFLLSQLMQVIGRAGRNDLESEICIQTSFPTHPIFGALFKNNYLSYAKNLLEQRKMFEFPPFSKQAIIRAISPKKEDVFEFLQRIYNESLNLFKNQKFSILFDPIPAKMERKAGKTQAYLLVQSNNAQSLNRQLNQIKEIIDSIKVPYQLNWYIELNPIEY